MELPNNFTTFYIVRHGETLANAAKIIAGHFDSPLNGRGEEQAGARGQNLKHISFDVIFSSDLARAKRTAELIKLERELAVNTKEILRERNFGIYEGKQIEKFYEENKVILEKLKTLSEKEKLSLKFYESYESNDEISARMLTFIREAAVTYPGKTILVVSHGSIMRAFLTHLGVASYDQLPAGHIDNLGYFVLKTDGIDFFVSETNGIHIKNKPI